MAVKKLILVGESWAWGYELLDPKTEPVDVYNILSKSVICLKEADSFDPWKLYDKAANNEYRIKHRYAGLLAEKLGIEEIVDLSMPGVSNEYIQRVLITYLSEQGYLNGQDASEIFVSIGWTSPERREFMRQDGKILHFGPWNLLYKYGIDYIDDFLKLYVSYFASEKESAVRYFMQVLQAQKLLESLDIKYLMHQTFYDNFNMHRMEDSHVKARIFKTLSKSEKDIWNAVDEETFVGKNTTASNYLKSQHENCMFKLMHPNEIGHVKLSEYFYNHIISHKLL